MSGMLQEVEGATWVAVDWEGVTLEAINFAGIQVRKALMVRVAGEEAIGSGTGGLLVALESSYCVYPRHAAAPLAVMPICRE